jgi:hypothetical protein
MNTIEKMIAVNGIQRPNGIVLSLNEKLEVRKLEQMDRSVREHERAHLRAARDMAIGDASFRYETGPDGNKYAVGGEVDIDITAVGGDTQATIEKAFKARTTAMAPSDPSPRDIQAAAKAMAMESKAYRRLSREQELEAAANNKESGKMTPPGVNAYRANMDIQEELLTILDLFA